MKKHFRKFIDAKKFVCSLKLKNQKEWDAYCKSGDKPDDIPRNPNRVYQKEWKGLGDWLGTGRQSNQHKKKNSLSYDESSKICIKLGIKSGADFKKFYSKNLIPKNIPASPPNSFHEIWKKNGGWGGFLGTGVFANKDRVFLSYEDSKKIIQKVRWNGKKLSSGSQFEEWSKSDLRPNNIPSSPERTYKKQGTWISWGDWLGTGNIAPQLRKFKPFVDARKFVHSLKLKNQKEWFTYSKSDQKPPDLPAAPHLAYKDSGWISYSDWLGTDTIAPQLRKFRPFVDARKFVHSLKLKNQKEWTDYYKSEKRPLDIPTSPRDVYKKEWKDMGDWLGTFNQANRYKKYRTYTKAKEFAHTLNLKNIGDWKKYCKSGKKPADIPAAPDKQYENEWKTWGEFLGTGAIASQNKSKDYLSWKEAKPLYKKLAQKYNLRTYSDWEKFAKSHKKLLEKLNLPQLPERVYSKERIEKSMRKNEEKI